MPRRFTSTWYKTDTGEGYKMRVRTDWTSIWLADPSESPTTVKQSHVKISKSNREYGIRPRYAVLSKTDVAGTPPNEVTNVRYLKIPVQSLTAASLLEVGTEYTGGSPPEAWKLERIEGEKLS